MAALPVEAVDLEDLRGIRAGRYKRRETWKQEDQTGKILYEAGMAVGNAMEGLEDVLRELAEEGDYGAAARARRVTELRKQVKEAQAVYKKIECGAKHGWSMAVAVYETHLETADMTEEEAKRLQAELKSRKKVEGENQKGGKYKIPKLKHEEPETVTQQVAAAPTWNWQNMMPPAMLQAMMMGGMPMMGMGNMPQWNNAGGSGTAVQSSAAADGKRPGGQQDRKRPCNNCGSLDHWSYNSNCPNYHLYVAGLQAKAETAKKMATGSVSTPKTEGKEYKISSTI